MSIEQASENAIHPAMIIRRTPELQAFTARLARDEPRFFGLSVLLAIMAVPTMLALGIDDRLYNSIAVWEKPLKFQLALIAYLLTLTFYARWLPTAMARGMPYRIFSWVVVISILLEIAWIMGAAANGTGSHFNVSTPAMALIYPLMGVLAVTLTSAALVYGIAIQRNRHSGLDPAFRLSLLIGLVTTFVLTVLVAGYMAGAPGHWVGGNRSDSEAAIIMGWARDGGDLRVAHFFATHCMHFIPLAGYLAARQMKPAAASATVWFASLAWCSLVVFTFMQALAGKPFLAFLPSVQG